MSESEQRAEISEMILERKRFIESEISIIADVQCDPGDHIAYIRTGVRLGVKITIEKQDHIKLYKSLTEKYRKELAVINKYIKRIELIALECKDELNMHREVI